MTDFLKASQHSDFATRVKSSLSANKDKKILPEKKVAAGEQDSLRRRYKKEPVENGTSLSQIATIPNDPTLDGVLSVIFPNNKNLTSTVKAKAETNFRKNLPFVIGERRIAGGFFVYDDSHEMVKLYSSLRIHEGPGDFPPPRVKKEVFEGDQFFLFAGSDDPVIALGRGRDMEGKGLSLVDVEHMLRFSEFNEVSEDHMISMARLTFSLLLSENIIADNKGIDSWKFSRMIPENEKKERYSDLTAFAACKDESPLFSLLMRKGIDPFRTSMLFDSTPAELATRDKALKT